MSANFLQRQRQVQSKRSNAIHSNSRTEYDQSDYQIVIQFQLRRQRQKNRILEQRLLNKQAFIQQMKEYQDELTLAYEKCQQELIVARKALEQFCGMQRSYEEETSELKVLIIRLEEEINLLQREKEIRGFHSSGKDPKIQEHNQVVTRKNRAKTLMNNEQDSPIRPTFQSQLHQSVRLRKFVKQFLMMSECFYPILSQGDSLKSRLKVAWKWIKQVVKEWNELKNQKLVLEDFLGAIHRSKKIRITKGQNLKEILNKIRNLIETK